SPSSLFELVLFGLLDCVGLDELGLLDAPLLDLRLNAFANPIACPFANLSKNEPSFNLSASFFVSINRFSVKTAGMCDSLVTCRLARFLPRLVTSGICLTTSVCKIGRDTSELQSRFDLVCR